MIKEEIIEMVMQIGCCDRPEDDSPALKMFVTFAKLVAAKEREACAVICETYWNRPKNGMSTEEEVYGSVTAELIRARGQE